MTAAIASLAAALVAANIGFVLGYRTRIKETE